MRSGDPPALCAFCPAAVRRLSGLRREFLRLVVFVVSVVFVCGSFGVVAVSGRSGRRVGGSALRVACRSRVRSSVRGVWLPAWRVRPALVSLRGVLRGRRLSALRRAALRVPGGLVASVPAWRSWSASRVGVASLSVLRVLFGLRAVRAGAPLRFFVRPRVRGAVSWRALVVRAFRVSSLPPRACGRVGCVRRGGRLWAWLLWRASVGGVASALWLPCVVPAGLAPVVAVWRPRGGGGGGRRPAVASSSSVFSAFGAGSALWLSSPAVVSAVRSGVCPVSLALRVFRWPVRSAVLWALWAALSSPRCASLGVPRSLLAAFVRACLGALGWRFSAVRSVSWRVRGAFRGSSVGAFLSSRSCSVALPSSALSWAVSAGFSSSAVVAALRSVVRCLGWLASRSSGAVSCPPALRPALASVAAAALRLLGR